MKKFSNLLKANVMPLRLLYAAIIIVGVILIYKSIALLGTVSMIKEAPLGNSIGRDDAPYTIVEFVDYTCPFCKDVHPALKSLVKNNRDIRVVYRHIPVHEKESFPAIQLALAAGIQGKFEPVHNRLMEDDREIDDDYRKQISQEYNLDYDKLMKDLKGHAIGLFLLENLDAAKRLRVRSTPTFVFGDLVYEPKGSLPTEQELLQLVEQAYLETPTQ
jgi:protein-disulfide isomerase